MSYSNNISSINGKVNSMGSFTSNVKNLDMNSVWKGSAATFCNNSLNEIINRINKERENIQTFNSVLDKVEKLKELDSKIQKERNSLYGLDSKKDFNRINAINSAIRWYTNEREKLKASIISMLGSIAPDAGGDSSLSFNNTTNFDYICDIKELEEIVRKCRVYPGNVANLYNDVQANGLSGMDFVNSQLDGVKNSYTGREAAVNSVLMSLMLASNKGVKYKYTNYSFI